jgi:hypothetical protein
VTHGFPASYGNLTTGACPTPGGPTGGEPPAEERREPQAGRDEGSQNGTEQPEHAAAEQDRGTARDEQHGEGLDSDHRPRDAGPPGEPPEGCEGGVQPAAERQHRDGERGGLDPPGQLDSHCETSAS